jgi:hypothetical protein
MGPLEDSKKRMHNLFATVRFDRTRGNWRDMQPETEPPDDGSQRARWILFAGTATAADILAAVTGPRR